MLRTPRIRLFCLVCIPVLFSAFTMAWLVTTFVEDRLRAQHNQAAETLTAYLAMSSAERLVNRDLLGINLLLTKLRDEGSLQFASVYDGTNQLVAQAGQEGAGRSTVVSREITFQDTSAGYIQVGFSEDEITRQRYLVLTLVLLVHAALLSVTGVVIFLLGDFVAIWINGVANNKPNLPQHSEQDITPVENLEYAPGAAILVLKLRPTRLQDDHANLVHQAIKLYDGNQVEGDGDSIVAYFDGTQAILNATCTALLLSAMVLEKGPPLTLKVGLHWVDDEKDVVAVEKATKHASYLSSISEQNLLASALFETQLTDEAIQYEPFHSSLAPDGEVILVQRVANQDLIDRQAMQLLNG